MDNILGAREFRQSHRSPRVELLRTDADFGAETEFKSVGEPGRGIYVHGGGIDFTEEPLAVLLLARHDRVRVMGTEPVDMIDRLVQVLHHLHGDDKIEIFLDPVGHRRRDNPSDDRPCFHIPLHLHTRPSETIDDDGQEHVRDAFMHQEFLGGIAYRRPLDFSIEHDIDRIVRSAESSM